MPCYEYHCDACGHDFEEMQKITDKPIRICPSCHARKAHRMISRTSFVLKGTGWYATDYARSGAAKADPGKGKGKEAKADGSSPATTETKADAGTETKAAAGTEARADQKKESKGKDSSRATA